jgi:leader peptidase (prepilin peptidase)/N-methyltransferase
MRSRIVKFVWILGHLLYLSAEDVRERQLSMTVVGSLALSGLIYAVCMGSEVVWEPGVLLLLAGYLSREKIGYGDGWLMLALGAWLSLEELLAVFAFGLGFCVLAACITKEEEMPLVPFLTAAFVLGGWI